MSFDLSSRVILVTGGGGFLALEFGRALGAAGAIVVLADIDEERAELNASALRSEGLSVVAAQLDTTDPASDDRLVASLVATYGRLDGLLNGAAIDPKFDGSSVRPDLEAIGFADYPLESWRQSVEVNLTGTFLVTQAAVRHFERCDRGVIVNIGSIYGLVGPDQRLYSENESLPPPRFKPVDYSVTKSALVGFTRYLAAYFAGTRVRVNLICYGGIERSHDSGFVGRYSRRNPMARMGRLSEVGGAVVFLFSDESSYMSGAEVVVDGGYTAW